MDFWGTPNIQTVTSLSKGNFYSTYVTMWFEDQIKYVKRALKSIKQCKAHHCIVNGVTEPCQLDFLWSLGPCTHVPEQHSFLDKKRVQRLETLNLVLSLSLCFLL